MKDILKNISIVAILIVLSVVLSACGCEHQYDAGVVSREATCTLEGVKTFTCVLCNKTHAELVECIPHDYEDSITKKATFDEIGERTFVCKYCGDTYTEDIPQKERNIIVKVTDKKNIPHNINNYRFSDRVQFTFYVENQCDKEVKGVEGVLVIQDLFGSEILSINCDFTGQTIPVGGFANFSGLGLDINQFKESHVKLYSEKFEDLNFEYELKSIVYTDGTTKSFE